MIVQRKAGKMISLYIFSFLYERFLELELLLSNPPQFRAGVVHILAHLPRRRLLLLLLLFPLRSWVTAHDELAGSIQRLLRLPLDPLHQFPTRRDIVDQPDDLARRPDPIVHVPVDKDLPPALPAHKRRHLLEFPALALPLHLHGLLGDLVAEQAACVAPPPQHELRVRLLRLDDGPLNVVVDGGFERAHEARAHVDALGPERQRCGEPLPVREAPAGDEGHRQALPGPAQQDEVCDVALAHVARALEAVDRQEIHPEVDGALRVPDRGAFVQDGAAGGFQLLDDRAGGVTGRLDDPDARVYDGLGVTVVVWWDEGGEEGQVYGEGVGGHGFAALDLGAEVSGRGLREGCELGELLVGKSL